MTKPTPAQIEAAAKVGPRQAEKEKIARFIAHRHCRKCTGDKGYGSGGDGPRYHSKACDALTADILEIALTAAAEVGECVPSAWLSPEQFKLAAEVPDNPAHRTQQYRGYPATPVPQMAAQQNARLEAQRIDVEIAATIERCAQVAARATLTVGDATETRANCVATIRALKEKP